MSVEALCIGHACWDIGFILDGYPAEDSKAETQWLVESGGGPAANAAWLLARWGAPTALAALVGDDDYGARARRELEQAGVDCRLVEVRPGHATPVSAILINRVNGSRTICNRKLPVRLALSPDRFSGLNPRLLLFDGHEPEASLAAMQAFPSAIMVLDAGSRREGTQVLAQRADYLVCSQRFAEQAAGKSASRENWRACVRRVRELNGKVAVVTLGQRGLIFDDGSHQEQLPALPVTAVDTTGAGDLFHGAFAYALLQKMDLRDALRLATVTAGLSVQRFGGRPSAPGLPAVLRALNP